METTRAVRMLEEKRHPRRSFRLPERDDSGPGIAMLSVAVNTCPLTSSSNAMSFQVGHSLDQRIKSAISGDHNST